MKGKKVLLSFIIVLLLVGVGAGCWYFGSKSTKSNDTKEKAKKGNEDNSGELKVKYEKKEYNRSTDNKGLIITNSITYPVSISEGNSERIIGYLNDILMKDWDGIKENTDTDIENYDPDFNFDDSYGVEYTTNHYVKDNVIVFNVVTEGSMGGVGWHESRYFNFDLEKGNVLEISDICKNVKECKSYMKKYFLEKLKKDQRFTGLDPDYEDEIEEAIFKVANFGITKDGLILIVPEYEIGDGTMGIFSYIIPNAEINKYLKDEYQV